MLFESLMGLKCDKHTGPWLAFNGEWFDKHQRKLLWLLNAPVIKHWFRWCLRIRRCDAATGKPILKIRPNAYHVPGAEPDQFIGEFRSHAKYSKRLYFAFRLLWWVLHSWDALFVGRYAPRLAFGFATLTAYPDPDPETNSCDGYVARILGTGESWASLISGAGTHKGTSASASNHRLQSASTTNEFDGNFRVGYVFATGLQYPALAATLGLYGLSKADGLSANPNLCIYSFSPASDTDWDISEYNSVGSTEFSNTVTYSSWTNSVYNDFVLNQPGLDSIALKARFGARNANYDVAQVAPAWSASQISEMVSYAADVGGTSLDPKLTVTYVVAGRMNPINPVRPAAFSPGMAR